MNNLVKARAIVDAVLEELSGRSGIGNALENVDDDVRRELRDTLIDLVLIELS
jgi:hypothetical protein